MSPPERKRKKTKQSLVLEPTPESTPITSLPDDLVVSCLARVSRLQYPTLSFVSKSFRSLLASPHLYETRSSLGRTESCLYVCIRFPDETIPRWFTLCQKPKKKNKRTKKASRYVLAKLPTPPSRSAHWSGLVAVGSDIYNIGGPIDEADEPSSSVSILDCRSNTWREGPSMLVERDYPHANVIDGKIYVAGDLGACVYPCCGDARQTRYTYKKNGRDRRKGTHFGIRLSFGLRYEGRSLGKCGEGDEFGLRTCFTIIKSGERSNGMTLREDAGEL